MAVRLTRRKFLLGSAAIGLEAAPRLATPALSRAASRPWITHGVQSGDVDVGSGMLWARADRPARMQVDIATTEGFRDAIRLPPVDVLPESDFAAKQLVEDLPAGQEIFYRVRFADLSDVNAISEPVVGRFRTAPADRRSIRFAWSGDTAGQGWGIDASRGGMRTYATMLRHDPDFFIHCGDTVYCDSPIRAEHKMLDGTIWKNLVTEEVEKVAETLAEFRGRFKYNLLDQHVRAFNAAVPIFVAWDDHEVMNNRSPSTDLSPTIATAKNPCRC
jgi:alkaline phosphatase D